MSDMKCPFCQQELKEDVGYDGDYSCPNCGTATYFGSPELWQELIRTKEQLRIRDDELTFVCTQRMPELERTRKALEIAVDALNRIDKQLMTGIEMTSQARSTLEQITALEQKDK